MEQQEYAQRGYLREDFRLFHLKGAMEEQLDWHYHTFHKLIFFLGGQSGYGVEGRSYPLEPGDVILGLPSSGVHSNGFSLVRKVLDVEHTDLKAPVEALGGKSLGETLLAPTRIYVKSILALMEQVTIKSVSHITGGGFYENIPRSLPKGMTAKIKESDVPVLPIFDLIQEKGNVPRREMFNTFNMGIGMTVVVSQDEADKALEALKAAGEQPVRLGEIVAGDEGVILW